MKTKSIPVAVSQAFAHTRTPWRLEPTQSDQGETSVICDARGRVLFSVPSPIWDPAARAECGSDFANASLLLAAPKMLSALKAAEKALEILADEHEAATRLYEAGGWATDALKVVRKAIGAAESTLTEDLPCPSPVAGLAQFRVAAKVILVADGISAYDHEAALRYARESLQESRKEIGRTPVDLGFADGALLDAVFVLPPFIDAKAKVTSGEVGDPEGTMAQAEFEIQFPATVEFNVDAPKDSTTAQVKSIAQALLSTSKGVHGIPFDDHCLGSEMKLSAPIKVAVL